MTHTSKTISAESAQANSHTVVTVQDNHLSNVTSDHFICLPNEKNMCKTTTKKMEKNVKKWKANIR